MEIDNWKQALRIVVLGVVVTCLALLVLPSTAIWQGFAYTEHSAFVGSTFGGIAGPFLSFTALIVLFFSLREQARTNDIQRQQFREMFNKQESDKYLDLTFKLIEILLKEAERNQLAFMNIAGLDETPDEGGVLGENPNQPAVDSDYMAYARVIKSMGDSFLMTVHRLESKMLTLNEQAVLQRILTMKYEPYLQQCKAGYAKHFSDDKKQPVMLIAVNQQLNVLEKQQRRIEAELKINAPDLVVAS